MDEIQVGDEVEVVAALSDTAEQQCKTTNYIGMRGTATQVTPTEIVFHGLWFNKNHWQLRKVQEPLQVGDEVEVVWDDEAQTKPIGGEWQGMRGPIISFTDTRRSARIQTSDGELHDFYTFRLRKITTPSTVASEAELVLLSDEARQFPAPYDE